MLAAIDKLFSRLYQSVSPFSVQEHLYIIAIFQNLIIDLVLYANSFYFEKYRMPYKFAYCPSCTYSISLIICAAKESSSLVYSFLL